MNKNEKKKGIKREITTFEMRKKLSSYEIGCDLAKRIEDYLFNKVPGLAGVDIDDMKERYSVEITDDLGTEKLNSIYEYSGSLFPDYTKRIFFNLWTDNLIVKISFDIEKINSDISVGYTGENAREITTAIYQGIVRIMDSNKTKNRFYHSGVIEVVIMITWGAVLLFAILSFAKLLYTLGIIFSCIFVIYTLYMTVGKKIHPYTLFDSTRSHNYKKWSDWFLKGIVSFIIFDVLLAIILKKFYGK